MTLYIYIYINMNNIKNNKNNDYIFIFIIVFFLNKIFIFIIIFILYNYLSLINKLSATYNKYSLPNFTKNLFTQKLQTITPYQIIDAYSKIKTRNLIGSTHYNSFLFCL